MTALPAILMAVPFGAMVAVQIAGLINQVGANSLVGAASGVGIVRQGAPITAGLLMGGAAASAIASDLGARAIREELDALRVMGVDPVRHLVVPRFLALIVLAPVLCAIIIASSVAASFILSLDVSDVAPGTYWLSFGAFAKMADVWFAIAKAIVFAAIVGIVSSLRGMEAKGGPRGVADAVNSSVVLNVVGILFANLAITQLRRCFSRCGWHNGRLHRHAAKVCRRRISARGGDLHAYSSGSSGRPDSGWCSSHKSFTFSR